MYAAAASSALHFLLAVVVFFFTAAPFSIGHVAVAKETHLHFYLHEVFSGPNATVSPVNGLSYNPTSPSFGDTVAIDDLLAEGPEPSAKPIGRAQGTAAVTSQDKDTTFTLVWNFVFSSGDYNGSTLALFGRAVLASSAREFSVVGGTGQFRLARGYVVGKKLTTPAGSLGIEFDAYIEHY